MRNIAPRIVEGLGVVSAFVTQSCTVTRLTYLLQTPKALFLLINQLASLLAITLELMEGPLSIYYCQEEWQRFGAFD
jgi:hypothetical protein